MEGHQRFVVVVDDPDDVVAKGFQPDFQVHRDECFVFYDEHPVGRVRRLGSGRA